MLEAVNALDGAMAERDALEAARRGKWQELEARVALPPGEAVAVAQLRLEEARRRFRRDEVAAVSHALDRAQARVRELQGSLQRARHDLARASANREVVVRRRRQWEEARRRVRQRRDDDQLDDLHANARSG
jgi:hypothetical protein